MTTHVVKGTQPTPLDIDTAGETWHVTAGASITSADNTISLEEEARNTHLVIDGTLISEFSAVAGAVNHITIDIGRSATLLGGNGVLIFGANEIVENHGLVTATAGLALGIGGAHSSITNFGEAIGLIGLGAAGNGGHMINEKSGIVKGSAEAVLLQSLEQDTMKFVNHGTLVGFGDAPAVLGGLGRDIVQSDGHISGDINLGEGNDVADLRGGSLHGQILAGLGDDTLVTDSRNFKLTEDTAAGFDQVKSTVSYHLNANVERLVLLGKANISGTGNAGANVLTGNNGDNVLHGGKGFDVLDGGRGDDKLFGDAGRDVFHFATGGGHDAIEDFHHGADNIELVDWQAVHSFASVKNHAHDHGRDVIIEAGHDSLTIHGLHKADLRGADFIFAA